MARLIPDWELIFSQSRANGGEYGGDKLPVIGWPRPPGTWLQKRLAKLREDELGRLKGEERGKDGDG